MTYVAGVLCAFPDNPQLNAQIPAPISSRAYGRYWQASVRVVQDLHFSGNGIYRGDRIPKREDNPAKNR